MIQTIGAKPRLTAWMMLLALACCWTNVFGGEAPSRPATQADLQKIQEQLKALATEVQSLRQENTQLRQELTKLKESRPRAPAETSEELDLAKLREAAQTEAAAEAAPETSLKETVFKAKGLGLQALNPEISITGDMFAMARDDHGKPDRSQSDFGIRGLDAHIQSYIDPYTRFKSAIEFHEGGETEIGEAYFTRFGVLPGLNVTFGKFRQQFGVVNRWHKHALDQYDFPLALREIFGDDGLNQTGLSLEWTMPSWGRHQQELTVQITDGDNDRVFGQNALHIPVGLVHYKNYWDVNKDTYAEVGLTALVGQNDEWNTQVGSQSVVVHNRRWTTVLGADFSMLWEPTDRMRYRNVEWRTEGYLLNKGIEAPDGSGSDTLNAWGAYSYIQTKLTRTWLVGLRGDYYEPDTKSYANAPGLSLAPLAVTDGSACRWGLSPYVTWQPTPFLKCRLEYDHVDGKGMEDPDDVLRLQFVFAVGPHKHERY